MELGTALWVNAMEFRVVWEIDVDAKGPKKGPASRTRPRRKQTNSREFDSSLKVTITVGP